MNWYKKAQEEKEEFVFRKSPVPHTPLTEKGGWEEGERREKILCDAIRKLAEIWNIGWITEPLHIDTVGDISMLQKQRITPGDYINLEPIDPNLVKIAVDYAGYGPGISSRWLKLNHFTWEKMLGDMGLLPRHTVDEEEFLRDIS